MQQPSRQPPRPPFSLLPPGYDAAAARSTLRRYPREARNQLLARLPAKLRAIAGTPTGGVPLASPDLRARLAPGALEEQIERMQGSQLAALWLGHATVLLRYDGRWLLTDPVLSERIGVRLGGRSLGLTVGPKRLLPTFDPARLPPIDMLLLSHAHFDHLDRPTLARIVSKRTRVLVPTGIRGLLPRGFGDVVEVPWDTRAEIDGLALSTIKPAHWGARTMWDRHRGYTSFVVEGGAAGGVLYAGDTAQTEAFAGLDGLALSIFGIGAYDPWIAAHANPEQVWAMHAASGARRLLPMHHSTFVLSDEPLNEPLERLLLASGDLRGSVVGEDFALAWNDEGNA